MNIYTVDIIQFGQNAFLPLNGTSASFVIESSPFESITNIEISTSMNRSVLVGEIVKSIRVLT